MAILIVGPLWGDAEGEMADFPTNRNKLERYVKRSPYTSDPSAARETASELRHLEHQPFISRKPLLGNASLLRTDRNLSAEEKSTDTFAMGLRTDEQTNK